VTLAALAAFPLLPASQSFDFDTAADKAPLGRSIKASTFGTVICCTVSKWVCLKMAMFMLG
jgi:hypothetical protein